MSVAYQNPLNAKLKGLLEFSSALTQTETLLTVEEMLVNHLTRFFDYELAIVYLSRTNQVHLHPAALSWQKLNNKEKEALHLSLKNQILTLDQIPQGIINRVGAKNTDYIRFPSRYPRIQSTLFVPLKTKTNSIGLLGLESEKINVFTPEDKQLLFIMGALAAAAINNIRLQEQHEQERNISDTLQDMSATLASNLELDTTLSIILSSLAQIIAFDSAAIYLLTPNDRLKMVAGKGIPHTEVTLTSAKEVDRFPLDEAVVSGKTTITVSDVTQDNRWTSLKGTEYIRSWLGVPLLIRGTPIGLFTIDRSAIDPFTDSQIALTETFASQSAVAIENARLFSQVTTQQERLRKLSNKVVEAQEKERRRISRELHDEMGQSLTAIKLMLQILAANLSSQDNAVTAQVNEIIHLADHSLQEVRRLAMDLRPSILDDLGLVPTLHWYQNQFQKRNKTKATLCIAKNLPRLSPNTETALYRVVQEALTNISRHAEAQEVEISLSLDGEAVYCSITDDGKGFSEDTPNRLDSMSVGLTSMLERIEALSGQISIESKIGAGTSIFITIPNEVALNSVDNRQ